MSTNLEELEKENTLLREELEKIKAINKTKKQKRKRWLVVLGGLIAGKSLKDSIYNSITEFNEQKKISRNTASDLVASIIRRLTRIGVVALLFALLPTTIMIYQNILLKRQNKKIQEQTYLSEAARRSSQMYIMGDVLSDINNEIEQKGSTRLSNTLVGRIVSLSRAMKPYRYLVGDEIIEQEISPERGQLLISLIKSNIEPSFFVDRILQESDFTKSELSDASLRSAVLRDVNLNYSNFSNASLLGVDFIRASLKYVDFSKADLEDANFTNADLSNSNLSSSILLNTNFTKANLTNVLLDSAIVSREDWLVYIKDKLKLKGAEKIYDNYKTDSVFSNTFNKKVLMLLKK